MKMTFGGRIATELYFVVPSWSTVLTETNICMC